MHTEPTDAETPLDITPPGNDWPKIDFARAVRYLKLRRFPNVETFKHVPGKGYFASADANPEACRAALTDYGAGFLDATDIPGTVAVAWWCRDGEWVIDQCAASEVALRAALDRTRHLFSPREHRVVTYERPKQPIEPESSE